MWLELVPLSQVTFLCIFRPLAWVTASSPWSDFLSQARLPKQNRACPGGAGPPEIVSRSVLEDDLQRQLHVERLAGANPRCAVVVSNRIRRYAQAAACQAREVAQRGGVEIAHTASAAGRRKILAIENVEQLDSELRVDAFRDLRVLDHGEVYVTETRAIKKVARQCSIGSRRRRGKRGRIDPRNASAVE